MDPMDVDPIDGGPKTASNVPPLTASPSHESSSSAALHPSPFGSPSGNSHNNMITKEEEAKQAIEQLRGEDLAGRIAASNHLEGVAAVLGPKRTREVRIVTFDGLLYTWFGSLSSKGSDLFLPLDNHARPSWSVSSINSSSRTTSHHLLIRYLYLIFIHS